jgi:hypothetical protein
MPCPKYAKDVEKGDYISYTDAPSPEFFHHPLVNNVQYINGRVQITKARRIRESDPLEIVSIIKLVFELGG